MSMDPQDLSREHLRRAMKANGMDLPMAPRSLVIKSLKREAVMKRLRLTPLQYIKLMLAKAMLGRGLFRLPPESPSPYPRPKRRKLKGWQKELARKGRR